MTVGDLDPPAALHVVSRRRRAASLLVVLALGSAGCAVRLLAPYDPVVEEGITHISNEVGAFLAVMEATNGTPEAAYRPNVSFYARTAGALRTLRLRSEVTPKSEKIVESIDLISTNVERLRVLHAKSGEAGLSAPVLAATRSALEVQFRAMFKLLAEMRRDR